jgi:hypothetical protein
MATEAASSRVLVVWGLASKAKQRNDMTSEGDGCFF